MRRTDAWEALRPGEPGYTYDGKQNAMLGPYNRLRKRLDRMLLRAPDWRLSSIELVGTQAIPGLAHEKRYKRGARQLPVLPSDHFGLFATLQPA